jgi:hypothetical protein
MTKWFVTVDKYCSYPNPEEHVWTISRDPNDTGWETDSGYSGYGLLKKDAEELAGAANRIEKLEAALLAVKLTSVDFVAVTIAVEALEEKDG